VDTGLPEPPEFNTTAAADIFTQFITSVEFATVSE